MFTGIIENLGVVKHLEKEKDNLHIAITADIASELKIDQSVAHNGVCLTVVEVKDHEYLVTAIKETIDKSNLGRLKIEDKINLERAMRLGDRLDGHIVQGHVDQTAVCTAIEDQNGSWLFTFDYSPNTGNITIEKGSVTVNGVSLTVLNSKEHTFSVAIIPYTFEHTNFKYLSVGDIVNLEFDILGKYVSKIQRLNS